MKVFLKKSFHLVLVLIFLANPGISSLPNVFASDTITSVFLILPGPITVSQDLRLSLWSDGRLDSGDITGGGAINGAASHYASFQTVISRIPDANGRLKITFGDLTGFPIIYDQNQFLMVEYKDTGDPDTSYVVYNNTYLGSAMDRFPLIVNGPEIYQEMYANDATTADTFTLDRDDTGGDVTLSFGKTLNESLKWNATSNYFEFSDAVVVGGNINQEGNVTTLDSDNVGAGADVDIVANQGSDADGTLRYNATLNRWEISNDGGAFSAISTGAGGADDFESIYATDSDKTMTTGNGILTFDTGTNDFVVNSNDWNVTAAGDLDAASITSNGALTASGAVNLSGASSLRIREVADEAAATCTTVNEVVLDTVEDQIYVCTVVGAPGTWVSISTPVSLDLAAVQARRTTTLLLTGSFVDMTFEATDLENDITVVEHDNTNTDRVLIKEDGIYQMTYDYSVTLPTTVTGTAATARIRANDTTVLNGSVSDISLSANTDAIVQELTQTIILSLTSGDYLSVQLSGAGDLPTVNSDGVFTVTKMEGIKGDPGAAAGDSDTLDTLDSTQFLRSDTSDTFTSGQLTIGSGTTLAVSGSANIGDGTGDVFINSNDWDISSAGLVSGLSGLTSTGAIDFTGATSFSPPQGVSDPLTCSEGQQFYNSTSNTLKMCTATDTWTAVGGAGSQDFEAVYATDADNTLTTGNAAFTVATGTNDFIVDSNDWNVTAAGALDAASITSNGTLTANGIANIGDGGDAVAINSSAWDISSAGVASGFTGLTSTGSVNLTGSTFRGPQGASNPGTCSVGQEFYNTTTNILNICSSLNVWSPLMRMNTSQNFTSGTLTFDSGTTLLSNGVINFSGATSFRAPSGSSDPASCTVGQQFYNTTSNALKVCTAVNSWTIAVSPNGADLLDGVNSTQFLRSDTSDNYTAGTMTLDNGTTLAVNGVATIGDGGDNISVNSNTWDVSSAGVASGFTGLTSAGLVNFSGSGSFRIREVLDEATAACTSVNELVVDTVEGKVYVCTASGSPGTWMHIGPTKTPSLFYAPEYSSAVISADGTDNNGTLSAERDLTNFRNQYDWTAAVTTLQDIDVVLSVYLPDDFISFQATPIQLLYRTDDVDITDAQIDVSVLDTADASVTTSGATDLNSLTWAMANITFSGTPTFDANGRITISIKLQARKDGGAGGGTPRHVYIGPLIINYNR